MIRYSFKYGKYNSGLVLNSFANYHKEAWVESDCLTQSTLLSSIQDSQLTFLLLLPRLSNLSGQPVLQMFLTVIDNWPSWLSQKGKMTVEIIRWKLCGQARIQICDTLICSQMHCPLH